MRQWQPGHGQPQESCCHTLPIYPPRAAAGSTPPPEPVQHEEGMEKVLLSLVVGCKPSVLLPKPNLTADQVDPASCSDPFPHHCHQHPGHGGCRWGFLLGPPHKPGLHDSSSAPFLDLPVAQRRSPGHWCCLPEPEEAQDIAQLRKAWKLHEHTLQRPRDIKVA